MKDEKKINAIWKEWNELKKRIRPKHPSPISKTQHIFSSGKGEISCIHLPNYFKDGKNFYEICCVKTELDVQLEKAVADKNNQKAMEIKSFIKLDENPRLFEDVERFDTFKEAKKRCKELLDD